MTSKIKACSTQLELKPEFFSLIDKEDQEICCLQCGVEKEILQEVNVACYVWGVKYGEHCYKI
jgi:hypothetical protein